MCQSVMEGTRHAPVPADLDFWHANDIAAFQQQLRDEERAYVLKHSAFYRRLWSGLCPPCDIRQISVLPFTSKEDLRANQAAQPPFGEDLAARETDVIRVHRTSGTTGQAMNIAMTRADILWTAEVGARTNRAADLGPGHRIVHCLNYQFWLGATRTTPRWRLLGPW